MKNLPTKKTHRNDALNDATYHKISRARKYYDGMVNVMIKTLTKFGNSIVLVIPAPILELLKITLETPVTIELLPDSKGLVFRRDLQSKRTLTRYGSSSSALVLSPSILELLKMDLGDPLEIEPSADGKSLHITRAPAGSVKAAKVAAPAAVTSTVVPEKKRKAG